MDKSKKKRQSNPPTLRQVFRKRNISSGFAFVSAAFFGFGGEQMSAGSVFAPWLLSFGVLFMVIALFTNQEISNYIIFRFPQLWKRTLIVVILSSVVVVPVFFFFQDMATDQLDAIQQQFRQDYDTDMSESNYWNWVKRFTKEAIRQAKDFKPDVGDQWVADETYMKLGDKTVYFWDIIDSKSNYLLASHVSFSRGGREAKQPMKLAEQRAGKTPKVVITDKLRSYIVGIEEAFGADTKHRQGGPFKFKTSGESTAEIERFHRTLEQRTKVFQKYNDIDSIKLLTDGWLINYNFFKQNEGCGNIPPAQAASRVVPFKDWNDIVIPKGTSDKDYKVSLHRRASVKRGKPVRDATLTPIKADSGESA